MTVMVQCMPQKSGCPSARMSIFSPGCEWGGDPWTSTQSSPLSLTACVRPAPG